LILFNPLEAIGVIIGAIISLNLLKKKRKTNMSTWGSSRKLSIFMTLIPIILMVIIGVTNSKGINFDSSFEKYIETITLRNYFKYS
jgi:heme/copper-type cytochrome/quinol oxidase subunit 2